MRFLTYNKDKSGSRSLFMYKEKDSLAFLLLFFILLPYLMTVIILGREACPLSREISLEEYVPAVTASQISWDFNAFSRR